MRAKEISLIDLIIEILLHWRKIVILAVAGGILFGGAGYIRSYQNMQGQRMQLEAIKAEREKLANDETAMYEVDKARLEKQLTETQIYNVNAALMYEQIYQDRVLYQENSIIMKLDANNICKAQLVFLIKSADEYKANDIMRIYEKLVSGGEMSSSVAEEYEIEGSAISEIITLDDDSSEDDGNVFSISLVHYDEEQCEILVSAVVDYIKKQQMELQQILGAHEVVLVSQSFSIVKDMGIMNQQKNCLSDIASARLTAARLIDAFSAEELEYYNFMEGEGPSNTEGIEDAGIIDLPKVNFKYVVMGMVLAAFAYAFFVSILYVLGNTLKSGDGFQELYGIPQLGQISKRQKDKFLDIIDKWLISLRNKNKRVFTREEMEKLLAAKIKMFAKNNKLDTIYMVGCSMREESRYICEKIKTMLDKDVSIKILDNVLYDAGAMEELEVSQGAVLVESVGSALYTEIANEIELLQRQNIKILGGIVVE